jgi:hypothetical protein
MYQPIHAIAVEIVGIHPQNPRMLIVTISLDHAPPLSWRRHVLTACRSRPHDPAHEPLVEGDSIFITPVDERLEQEVAQVTAHIAQANTREFSDSTGIPEQAETTSGAPRRLVDAALTPETLRRIAHARRRAMGLSDEMKLGSDALRIRPDSDG